MQNKVGLEFIEDEIRKRISSFDGKRTFYRKKASQFTISASLLAALTTFLIGLSQTYPSKLISVVSLATSAGMTVLSSWDNLYSYRRRWIQNNDVIMKLYELNSDIQYKKACSGDCLSSEVVNEFYEKYQEILRVTNETWKQDRLTEKDN
jgi:hypothetical protein